jgi:hypothetical protein
VVTSTIAEAEGYVTRAGASPQQLTLQVQGRNGVEATLKVESILSGARAAIRFQSCREVEALGLKASLEQRLNHVGGAESRPDNADPETRGWLRRLVTNAWFVGIMTGVIAGVLLLLVLS